MPAMTMPLPVEPLSDLDDVQVGDEIQAQLKVTAKESHLEELVVTRPAPLEVSLAGGKAELRQAIPVLQPGEEVPDFQYTDQAGKAVRLRDLRGKYVVLTFIYTRCPLPDFCPLMDKKFAAMQQRIRSIPGRSEHVRLVSISFDPEHDTPAILEKHAERVGAQAPLWTFGVASHEELRKVAPSLGLAYAPGEKEIMHSLSTAVIDPEGKLAALFKGKSWEPETLMKEFLPLISNSNK
jgi:protein SCO1/2